MWKSARCIFDRSDQFHHNGSDYFPDGKRDECAGWSWQKEGAGKTCCENVPLLQKQGCGRGNPLSVLYVYAGSEKRRKETIECTLCDKTVQQSLCIQDREECSGCVLPGLCIAGFHFTVPSSESVRRLHPYNRSASRSARRWELADSPDPPDCRSGREAPVRYKQFRHGTGG